LVTSSYDLPGDEFLPVLDAPLATFSLVSVGAPLVPSPGHGPASHEHVGFSPDRFRPSKRSVCLVLGIMGFNPLAIVIATSFMFAPAAFSHCGGDVKGGFLNYFFVTPEVHRWHHSAKVPDGYGYSCNYGVQFSFWDIIFGTFYLPVKNGITEQPEVIGYPGGGLPDESNYLKLLLAPLGLYRPLSWFTQVLRIPRGPKGQQPAE
jgi:hypothetical protein